MSWTKKHDEFCYRQKLRPSTRALLSYIIRRTDKTQISEIEFDLVAFNIWVKKSRGTGYDRKTLKFALAQLDSGTDGLILISKSYTWAIHKIIVRPLSFVLSQNSQNKAKTPKLPTTNPMFGAEYKKTSRELLLQDISRLDALLKKLGMNCNSETLHRMWRYAGKKMNNVQDAVKYMLRCHKEKVERADSIFDEGSGITSPIGWLHDCLKFGRHIDCDETIKLPYFDSILALSNAVKNMTLKI